VVKEKEGDIAILRTIGAGPRNVLRMFGVQGVSIGFAGIAAGDRVLDACAAPAPGRRKTWINERIRRLYTSLYELGHCHSLEVWRDDRLVGGLYGVALGRVFYGESMFSRAADASKVALVALVETLRARRVPLIDCQVHTPLLAALGAREIPRRDFLRQLSALVHYAGPQQPWRIDDANVVFTPRLEVGTGNR